MEDCLVLIVGLSLFSNHLLDTNSYANEKLSQLSFDVVTMDGDVDRSTARAVRRKGTAD